MDSNLIVVVGLAYCFYILIATILLTTIAVIKGVRQDRMERNLRWATSLLKSGKL
jgi:uncharacterized membrane protein